jgi:hypothetical protein
MRSRELIIFLFFSVLASSSVNAETARVVTRENALREDCRFFSPVKMTVHYDDVVDLLSPSGDWFRARYKGAEGCIHRSAVQKRSVSLSGVKGDEKPRGPGEAGHSATEAEVSLAGKGFTQEVEDELRSENPEMKFDLVDSIESYVVSEPDLFEFIKRGGLLFPE